MSSKAMAEVVRFEVVRFLEEGQPKPTHQRDLQRFVEDNESRRDNIIVEIDPTGNLFADYLESAGFQVRRIRTRKARIANAA